VLPVAGFEWNLVKAARNLREHGIAFEEAISVFDDGRAIVEVDPDPDEERFKIVGMAAAGRLLAVIYAERGEGRVRIISAWKATRHEIKAYRQG
jgi:uncharacterized DUF497 family protein